MSDNVDYANSRMQAWYGFAALGPQANLTMQFMQRPGVYKTSKMDYLHVLM